MLSVIRSRCRRTLQTVRTPKQFRAAMLAFLSVCSLETINAQTVNISANKMPLDKVCKEFEKQTGYYFVYPKDQINQQLITVEIKNAGVQTALNRIFDGSPYQYKVVDKVVAVQKANEKSAEVTTQRADTLTVSGYVTSSVGHLPNASVTTSKTKKNTLTDQNGNFTLKGVERGELIQVTYVGYLPKTEPIVYNNVAIYLKAADNTLDNVVVKAYGTTSRRFSTGNIVTISGKEIENMPLQNPLDALAGRVPGLIIQRTSNNPSSPLKIEVRGRNAINGQVSSEPLILIDGVPLTILNLPKTISYTDLKSVMPSQGLDQSGNDIGLSPLFGLNVNDIESISVLKDAEALAIYGSRGANGVILINTKRAKPGVSKIDVGFSQGFTKVSRYTPALNLQDYLQYRREAYANEGITPSAVPGSKGYAPELMVWDTTRDVDWQRYLYGGTGTFTSANLGISGGSENSSYRISGGYSRQVALSTLRGSDQSGNVLVSLSNSSFNNKLKTSLQANFTTTSSNTTKSSTNWNLPPNFPEPFDSTGLPNWVALKQGPPMVTSFARMLERSGSKSSRLNSSLTIGYNIMKGFDFSATIGYMYSNASTDNILPLAAADPNTGNKGSHYAGNTQMMNLNIEPKLTYNTTIGQGVLNVLLGGSYQNSSNRNLYIYNSGYTSDDFIESLSYGTTSMVNNRRAAYKYAGAFSSIGYTYAEKYIVSLSGRRDGSSKFGPSNRFGNFGAVGLGWIITEEPFAKTYFPKAITYLKLRGSYGITGSDGVNDYQYLSQWGNFSGSYYNDYNGVKPSVVQLASNPNFHWQTNKKKEIGLEWELFSRINFSADIYDDRCNNQLVGYPLALQSGFSSVVVNLPANVKNSGFDFSASANVIRSKKVRWIVNFNMNLQDNKLISFPGIEYTPYKSLYTIGETLNSAFVYKSNGIDPQTGLRIIEDANKDGIVQIDYNYAHGTGLDDRIVTLDMNARFNGGFGTTFGYKNFNLNTQFSFNRRYRVLDANQYPSGSANIPYYTFNRRWTYAGQTDATVAKPGLTADGFTSTSDAGYKMINLVRCANLSLSYAAPQALLKKFKCSSLVFGMNTTNLFLLSNYVGVDPENGFVGGVPPTRNITFSINASF